MSAKANIKEFYIFKQITSSFWG